MKNLSRNDPCWCGSGKKYKKCHMESDLMAQNANVSLPPGIIIKTPSQIEGIEKSCQITKEILDIVDTIIRPGISTEEINQVVHSETTARGGIPAPLNYHGFPKSVCTSINEVICHGIPEERILMEGDIVNVDVTTIYEGYYGDASRMYAVGSISQESQKIIDVAKECMDRAIEQLKPYQDISTIGNTIQNITDAHGYSVVKDYGGHGVGVQFHEEPHIHHYRTSLRNIPMLPGMTFTIEPMINKGSHRTKLLSDNWTVITADNSLSAQWEHTILITETGYRILTD